MRLFSLFSRPAWESADVEKRANAVATSTDPALLSRLPEICRHDADAKVRLAAVKRIDDLSLLSDRARLDLAAEVRTAALARLRQLLLDPKMPLAARIRIVRTMEHTALLEEIAAAAVEIDLRASALERIQRTAFLVERCVKETDPGLRRSLLDRIDDPAQLERIAERARKSDKQLARLARERALAAKLAARDPIAIETRARTLCAALDRMLRDRGADAEARINEIEAEWNRLGLSAEAPLARRFRGLLDTLRDLLNPPIRPAPESTPQIDPKPVVEPMPTPNSEQPVDPSGATDSAPAPNAEIGPVTTDDAKTQRSERSLRRQWRERVHTAIAKLARSLEAGQLAEARNARTELQRIEQEWPKAHWGQTHLLSELEAKYVELERWHRWSVREQKRRLCESAESLAASGLHPDAVLTRVRELQRDWSSLTDGESSDADDGLTRRFRALIQRALAPTKPYFEKRNALRTEKNRIVTAQLDQIEAALADPNSNLEQLLEWRQTLQRIGSLIVDLVGEDRRVASERRKRLQDDLKSRIDALNEAAAEAKRKLIHQLRRQLASSDAAERLAIAKTAVPQWKALPRALRKTEKALWSELRALIDPVFELDRAAKEDQRREREARREALAQVFAEIDALTEADLDADALSQCVAALRQRFQSLARNRDDDQDFDRAIARIELRITKLRDERARMQRQLCRERACRLAELERRIVDRDEASSIAAELDALRFDCDDDPLSTRIAAARAALSNEAQRTALASAMADLDTVSDLAIRAELIADLPSPEAWSERRRALQMARLAEKLSGSMHGEDSVDAIWRAWLALPGTGLDPRADFDHRIETALERLLERDRIRSV